VPAAIKRRPARGRVRDTFSLGEQGPGDACILGCERHHNTFVGLTREQIALPRILDATGDLLTQIGVRPVDQQASQRAVSLFGDTARAMFAAGAPTARREPDPGDSLDRLPSCK